MVTGLRKSQQADQTGLVLYTRPDCHLCEVAGALLDECGLSWRTRNIESDLNLTQRYGTRIPVLFRPDVGEELGWPFDAADLKRFVGSNSRSGQND